MREEDEVITEYEIRTKTGKFVMEIKRNVEERSQRLCEKIITWSLNDHCINEVRRTSQEL